MNYIKVIILTFITLSSTVASSYEYGIKGELELKEKLGQLTPYQSSFLQNILDIQKVSNDSSLNLFEKNKEIEKLFYKGENLWDKIFPKPDIVIFIKDNFYYHRLCNAIINYYISTSQDYLAIDIYKKLILKSKQCLLGEIQIPAMINLTKLYMQLGQIESAKMVLDDLKANIDDDYFIDYTLSAQQNGDYVIAVNSAYKQLLFQYAIFDKTLYLNLKQEQQFFDMLLKAYEDLFYLPFLQLNGIWGSGIAFESYDQNSISKNFYYTNYNLMYRYAKFFFSHGDKKRAEIAYKFMKKALLSNANGSKEENIAKESFSPNSRTFPSEYELVKIPLMYGYLLSLYEADITSIKNSGEAKKTIQKAQDKFILLKQQYKKLPPEYKYTDGVLQTYKDLLSIKAKIYEKNKLYREASNIYDELIVKNEQIRESLPVKYRIGYFRGYAKDGYLGLIRTRVKLYNSSKTKKDFNNILSSINLLNSRQLKDLKPSYTKEQNLYDIQKVLKNDEMIYVIFDVGDSILCGGIVKNKTFAHLFQKNKNLDVKFYEIKKQLTKNQYYEKSKFLEISRNFTKPLNNFKNIKYIHLLSDGISSILPFSIYPLDEKNMVFDRYIVDYLTTLKVPSKIDFKKDAKLFAVGDAIYDKQKAKNTFLTSRSVDISGYFIRLPETKEEVQNISEKFHSSKLLLQEDAKESIVKNIPLKQYSYIHFATHGILGGEIPSIDEAALVLSKEEGEDSLLSASEIAKLDLDASLVVLSACNTGNGKYFRGEGVSGIARAFKIAGSKKVVASLWSVDSLSTLRLMESFYSFLLQNKQPSEALYLAKKHLQKYKTDKNDTTRGLHKKHLKYSDNISLNPYFWSAFILID